MSAPPSARVYRVAFVTTGGRDGRIKLPASNPYPDVAPVPDADLTDLVRKVQSGTGVGLGGPFPSRDRVAVWFAAALLGWGPAAQMGGSGTVNAVSRFVTPYSAGAPWTVDETWTYAVDSFQRLAAGELAADVLRDQGLDVGSAFGFLDRDQVLGKLWALLVNPRKWIPGYVAPTRGLTTGAPLDTTKPPGGAAPTAPGSTELDDANRAADGATWTTYAVVGGVFVVLLGGAAAIWWLTSDTAG